jgi:hypothetical protein
LVPKVAKSRQGAICRGHVTSADLGVKVAVPLTELSATLSYA